MIFIAKGMQFLSGMQTGFTRFACNSNLKNLLSQSPSCYFKHMNIFMKLLGAKTRNEISNGKLWEVTSLWGMDLGKKEAEVAQPEARRAVEGGTVKSVRVHIIKNDDNITNLTKQTDLL
jgi:hypothetical protein